MDTAFKHPKVAPTLCIKLFSINKLQNYAFSVASRTAYDIILSCKSSLRDLAV